MNLEIRFTLPNQPPQTIPIRDRMLVGTLLSNEIVIRAPDVEPIHAMIEEDESGNKVITDLGSKSGVMVNGQKVDVEAKLKIGDVILIGSVVIDVLAEGASGATDFQSASTRLPEEPGIPSVPMKETAGEGDMTEGKTRRADTRRSESSRSGKGDQRGGRDGMLFSPRNAKPSGNILEVVAYWGSTILDVDLFHPKLKNFENVTIGIPPKAHFIAGGENEVDQHLFVKVGDSGYRLRLMDDMVARIRKEGKVYEKKGQASIDLGRRDIAHISQGTVRYFVSYVTPPPLELPRQQARDPFFAGLMSVAALLYFVTIPFLWMAKPKPLDEKEDDIWAMVNVPEKKEPEKKEPPKPIEKPKPKEEPPKPKPEKKIAEVKQPPPKPKPPVPPPKPPTPVKPVEKEKPKQVKPVEKPVEKPTQALAQTPTPEQKVAPVPTPPTPKPPTPNATKPDTAKGPATNADKPSLSKLSDASKGKEGMPSTSAKNPDFKLAGPKNNQPLGKAGGHVGGGMNQQGGERKGNKSASVMGVEGVNNDKASGVNLSKLGLGAGKILDKTGPGAIKTNFRNSAGGAGGGAGSASKTYGLGGVGTGGSLGLAGAGTGGNFGSGSGGWGGGQGGTGGAGGSGLSGTGLGGGGLGSGFGKKGAGGGGSGRANVVVPPGDPVVSGGLTMQEVQAVIRANLNQIRHCYEQLLQRSPSANGKIKVKFVVDPNGRVSSASILSSTISDSVMTGCVTGHVSRWSFPKPRGGQAVNVSYPFVFNPL